MWGLKSLWPDQDNKFLTDDKELGSLEKIRRFMNTNKKRNLFEKLSFKPIKSAVFLFAVTWGCSGLAVGETQETWPAWRGPEANGSTNAGKYPTKLNENSQEWSLSLPGTGGSTPVTWGDHIFLTTPVNNQDAVMAVGFDGKEKWLTKLGTAKPQKHRTLGSSCNSSPTTDGNSIYAYFKSSNFASLDLSGNIRWKKNLAKDFGPEELYWDQGSSPVLTEKHVIIARIHGGDSWVAAFNKHDGELAWKTKRNYPCPPENNNGYTTPILYEENGKQSLLVFGSDRLTSYDSSTGKLNWWSGGFNPRKRGYWPAISSPVIVDDLAILPVGRDDRPRQANVFGVKLGGQGEVTSSHRAWARKDVGVFVPALAEANGKVYLLRNKGGVVCMDPKSGKTIWEDNLPEGRSPYYASPTIANNVLYAARNDGQVFVAALEEKGLKLLDSIDFGDSFVATPVPVKNRILLRSYNNLYCYK